MKRYKSFFKNAAVTALLIGVLSSLNHCVPMKNKEPIDTSTSYVNHVSSTQIATSSQEVSGQETPGQEEDKYATYPPSSYVTALVEALGVKSEYIYGIDWYKHDNVTRLTHNNGEPLTVAFTSTVSDSCREYSKEVLDYLFGIIGEVNDYYKYELVEYDAQNPANITINTSLLGAMGCIEHVESDRMGYGDHFVSKAIVHINEDGHSKTFGEYSEVEANALKRTLIHEILHVFGFSDVYDKDTLERNAVTLLTTSFRDDWKFIQTNITPNDYANLIACYFKPSGDIERDIETCLQLVEAYTREYYKRWAEDNFQIEEAPTKSIVDGVYSFSREVYLDQTRNDRERWDFRIEIQGDSFRIQVFDVNGALVEEDSGEIRYLSIENDEGVVSNAVAIMELVKCKSIFEDVKRGSNANSGFSNLLIYESGGAILLRDSNGNINKAKLSYQEMQSDIQQER